MKFFPITIKQHQTWALDLLYLSIALLLFYFTFLGSYSLFLPDEARYAEISREMLTTSNIIVPKQNNVVFLDKPILHYWLQMLAMKSFGMNEWAVRFFPALCALLGCISTYITGRLVFNRASGMYSAIILATTPIYFFAGHYANLDLEVAFFITLSLYSFLMATKAHASRHALIIFVLYLF